MWTAWSSLRAGTPRIPVPASASRRAQLPWPTTPKKYSVPAASRNFAIATDGVIAGIGVSQSRPRGADAAIGPMAHFAGPAPQPAAGQPDAATVFVKSTRALTASRNSPILLRRDAGTTPGRGAAGPRPQPEAARREGRCVAEPRLPDRARPRVGVPQHPPPACRGPGHAPGALLRRAAGGAHPRRPRPRPRAAHLRRQLGALDDPGLGPRAGQDPRGGGHARAAAGLGGRRQDRGGAGRDEALLRDAGGDRHRARSPAVSPRDRQQRLPRRGRGPSLGEPR